MPVTDPAAGEVHGAQVFVAVLGASNYTFAEATWTQGQGDWLAAHTRAFAFFGEVPALLGPDNLAAAVRRPNLAAAVRRPNRYDPEINPSYAELATHYGTAVLPARPRKLRDKAKASPAGRSFGPARRDGLPRRRTRAPSPERLFPPPWLPMGLPLL